MSIQHHDCGKNTILFSGHLVLHSAPSVQELGGRQGEEYHCWSEPVDLGQEGACRQGEDVGRLRGGEQEHPQLLGHEDAHRRFPQPHQRGRSGMLIGANSKKELFKYVHAW